MRRPIQVDDVVVLPSGRRAVAIAAPGDGRLTLAYINDHRPDRGDTVELAADLVRRIERGIVPIPYRANGKARSG